MTTNKLIERLAATDIDKLLAGDTQEWVNLRVRVADAKYEVQQHKHPSQLTETEKPL